MKANRILTGLCLLVLLFWLSSPATGQSIEKFGPFRGQIVDVETGEPIAGAAVLVIWWQDVPNPVQAQRKFYDAREAVTDAGGRFEVPRLDPPFFSFTIYKPAITYFAPGYQPEAKAVTPPDGQPFVDPTVVKMRRLKTKKELSERLRSRPGGIPLEKMTEFTKAINVERKMLGLEPLPIIVEERR